LRRTCRRASSRASSIGREWALDISFSFLSLPVAE
jgi:hypothetical protein